MAIIDLAIRVQSLGLFVPALLLILKATLILILARLLMLALPQISAASRHLLTTLAICSVLALPVLTLALPAWRLALLPSSARAGKPARQAGPVQPRIIGATGDEEETPRGTVATAITVAKAAHVVPEEKLNAFARALEIFKASWQGFLLLGAAFGMLAVLLRTLAGIVGVGRVARRSTEITDPAALAELEHASDHLGLTRPVHLLRSSDVTVPVVWGLARPILLLPEASGSWPSERLRVVLLHELAHVKRMDELTLLAAKTAGAFFWFHPLMWSLQRIARSECERACDDLVLQTGTKPSEYAEHLLSIAKAIPHVDPFRSVTMAMSRRSELEGRLLSILQPHIRRGNFPLRAIGMMSGLALLMLAPLASVRLTASPQPSTATVDVVASKEDDRPLPLGLAQLVDSSETMLSRYQKRDRQDEPRTGREWYHRGQAQHSRGRYQEAIAAFRQAVDQGYRVDDALYNIACGYAQMGDAATAVEWLHQAIDAGYDNFRHIASDSDFDPIRSSALFQDLVSEAPRNEQLRGERQADGAVQRYEMLRSKPASEGAAWFQAGHELLAHSRYDQSIEAFGKALAKGYKPSTSTYNIACAYARKGETGPGLEWLQKSIEEGFDSLDKLDDDADLDNLRQHPRFEELKTEAQDLSLTSRKGWMTALMKSDGDWLATLDRYRQISRKYSHLGRSWFNLGFASLQARQNQESVEAFHRALALQYRPPTTMYNIGCALARAHRTDAAIEWLRKAQMAGFDLGTYIDKDDDLDTLRDDERFQKLLREVSDGKHEEGEN